MNGLHEELCLNLDNKQGNSIPKQIDYSNPEEYLSSSIKSSFSIFSELFQGLFSSEIKCPTCNHTSTQYDQFNMVSLPLYCKEDHFNILITYIPRDLMRKFETRTYKFSTTFGQTLADLLEMLKKDLNLSNEIPYLPTVVEDDTIEEVLKDNTMLLKDLKIKLEFKRKKLIIYEMPVDWDSALDHIIHICFSTEIKKINTGISFKKRIGVPRILVIKPISPKYEDIYVNIMEYLKDIYPEQIMQFQQIKDNAQMEMINENIDSKKVDEEEPIHTLITEDICKIEESSIKNTNTSETNSTKKTEEEEKNLENQLNETTTENPKIITKPKGKKPRVSKRKKNTNVTNNNVNETSTIKEESKKKESKNEKPPSKDHNKEDEKQLDSETLLQDFMSNLPYSLKFVNKMKNIHACVLCNKKTCESCAFNLTHSLPFSDILDRCQANQLQIELNLFFANGNPKELEQSLDDPLINDPTVATGNANPNLIQCIELFSEKEVLSNENMWFCPICDEKKQAEKTIRMFYVSKYLIFHLKRFKSLEGAGNSKNNKKVKNNQPIDYPINELDLAPYVKDLVPHLKNSNQNHLKFRLIAVVLHEGKLDEGHYIALGRSKNGVWKKFDDERVHEINEKEVCHKNAYLLLYELI